MLDQLYLLYLPDDIHSPLLKIRDDEDAVFEASRYSEWCAVDVTRFKGDILLTARSGDRFQVFDVIGKSIDEVKANTLAEITDKLTAAQAEAEGASEELTIEIDSLGGMTWFIDDINLPSKAIVADIFNKIEEPEDNNPVVYEWVMIDENDFKDTLDDVFPDDDILPIETFYEIISKKWGEDEMTINFEHEVDARESYENLLSEGAYEYIILREIETDWGETRNVEELAEYHVR